MDVADRLTIVIESTEVESMPESKIETDALSLEYKRDYGTAGRNLEVFDFVNDPFLNSPKSVSRLLSPEEISNLSRVFQIRAI